MVVNDLLRPRREVIDPEISFQYALKAYKVNSGEDRLESNPERFFSTTYPSNAIKNVLKVVNEKLIGESNQGGFVLSGSYGSGKTHALVTLYNIFRYPEIASKWIEYHNIKFNLASIQKENNVCMLSTSEVDPDYLWEPIFKSLGYENLLNDIKRYPTVDIIESLAKDKKTAIFIDELERWYGSFNSEQDSELIESNRMFLQNLLEVASDNDNLFVFIGFLEENRELKEIINRINPRKEDMAATGDKEKIIIHRLFETKREEIPINKIVSVVDKYINNYVKAEISFENIENYRDKMISCYPFHPELLSILDDIYDAASESQNVRGEMQILADLVSNNYLDKDLFLISDLDVRPLQSIDYLITNRFTSDMKICLDNNLDYSKEILTSILLFTLDTRRGVAEKQDIYLSVLRPGVINKIDIEVTLDNLLGTAHYLHKKNTGYLFKDERNIFALIKSNAEKIKDEDAIDALAFYIRDNFFDRTYLIYGKDEIEDNAKLKFVLLLDSPHEKEELKNFLNKNIYHGLQYRNTMVIIKPNNDIYTVKFLSKMKRIMAIRQLAEDLNKDQDKINKVLEDEKSEFNRELKNAFGRYIRWGYYNGNLVFRQEAVEASADKVKEKVKSDISEIKEYVLSKIKEKETGFIAEDLLMDCKKYRKYPFISNEHIFYNALKELYEEKRIFIEGDNNKIYRGEHVNIQARMNILDPDYYPETMEQDTEPESNDRNNDNIINPGEETIITGENNDGGIGVVNEPEVVETEPVELETEGNSKRVLISNMEARLRQKDRINTVKIQIEIKGHFSKREFQELLMELPEKEGKYSVEIIGERDIE